MKKFSPIFQSLGLIAIVSLLISTAVLFSGCNKKFDTPEEEITDGIPVNFTIMQLKAMHTTRGAFDQITDDYTIEGIVTANDSTGNFYHEFVIQDSTGGIVIELSPSWSESYTSFPLGRKIYIKLKGLILGDYGGTIQLGQGIYSNNGSQSVDGFTQTTYTNYIVKGSFQNMVQPSQVTATQLGADTSMQNIYQSELIQLSGYQFQSKDVASNYADTTKQNSSVSFYLVNCSSDSIELYNSSYASFAGFRVPNLNGTITGIYTPYSSAPGRIPYKEIVIRDTTDIQFYAPRCDGSGGTPTGGDTISISDARNINGTIPAGTVIKGIIISNSANEAAGNFRIESEDGSAGAILYFGSSNVPTLSLGDKISVNIGGGKTQFYKGDFEISGISKNDVTANGSGTITPRTATIAQINSNLNAWASTLVTINNVTIKQGATSSTGVNDTITDGTGTIVTFVRTAANITMPAQATSITGYVSIYQPSGSSATAQLGLRDQNDVDEGSTPPSSSGTNFSAVYNFSSVSTTSGTTDPTTPPTVTGLTFGSFSVIGNSNANPSVGGRFSFTNWPLGATNASDVFTGSLDPTEYYQVTITPQSGKTLSLDSIIFTLQRSGTGVRQIVVRSSIDNFASNLPTTIISNNNLSVVSGNIVQITDASTTAQTGAAIVLGTDFSSITSQITLRFYGFNAEGTSGTFSLNNVEFIGATK